MLKLKTCEVMQQLEHLDCSINEFTTRVQSLTNLKTYAIIVHDKDKLEDGTPKKPHLHAILTFTNTTTSQVIANTLHVKEEYIATIKSTTRCAELYLIHKNDPEKYQYDPKDVIANFDYVDKYDGVEPKQKRSEIAKKIENGQIKQYNLYEFITIDEYSKNKNYYVRAFEYRQDKLKGVDRDMKCIFISGPSGVGKTTFAKMLASNKGYACYISSGGKNPLDDYKGQECIILDDLRDDHYQLSDFLKLCDNNTDSLVGCRFYNKSIAECRLLIVTSVKPIYDFYNYNDEPRTQLYRRFTEKIEMEREIVRFYKYNPAIDQYFITEQVINPISTMFDKDIASSFANDVINLLKLKKYTPKNENDLPF